MEMQNVTEQKRIALTHVIIDILDNWKVKAADQITILDLPKGTKHRALRRYHENTPLPDDSNVMGRVEHLLGIADALRTTYPRNYEMGVYWINRPHRHFENRSPLEAMIEDGLDGLMSVRVHLDCAYAWSLTDKSCARIARTKEQAIILGGAERESRWEERKDILVPGAPGALPLALIIRPFGATRGVAPGFNNTPLWGYQGRCPWL